MVRKISLRLAVLKYEAEIASIEFLKGKLKKKRESRKKKAMKMNFRWNSYVVFLKCIKCNQSATW